MLYANAYIVYRIYGGPEEGGWFYDAGRPLASVPIRSKHEKGHSYKVNSFDSNQIVVSISTCFSCQGKGEVEMEDEDPQVDGMIVPCQYCGEVPEDLMVAASIMQNLRDQLQGEVGRKQELRVALQDYFAESYPGTRPHYE